MNSVSIKKTIEATNKKIEELKSQSESINAELKKLEERNKSLASLLKRQEAIDQEYEALSGEKKSRKKNAAPDETEAAVETE